MRQYAQVALAFIAVVLTVIILLPWKSMTDAYSSLSGLRAQVQERDKKIEQLNATAYELARQANELQSQLATCNAGLGRQHQENSISTP